MNRALFVVRVLEGELTWEEYWREELDVLDWLYKKATEINDKRSAEIQNAKSKVRGR